MFAALFKRAEQSVDSAIGDLGNRIVISVPFFVALGFAAASLTLYANRVYGAELGTLIVAGAFCVLGFVVALVVKIRRRLALRREQSNASDEASGEAGAKEELAATAGTQSIFDDEAIMAVVTSAAPIVLPAILRTGLKNWPILVAAAAGLYVVSRPDTASAGAQQTTPSQSS
jgi:hypothetical protein